MWKELIQAMEPEAHFSPGATIVQLKGLEAALEIATFPVDLQELLQESNGILGKYGVRLIWSAEEIARQNKKMRTLPVYLEENMSFENLLFFSDAGNGDLFAFRIVQGKVKRGIYAWDHEDDSRTQVAFYLKDFLERWLRGKIRT